MASVKRTKRCRKDYTQCFTGKELRWQTPKQGTGNYCGTPLNDGVCEGLVRHIHKVRSTPNHHPAIMLRCFTINPFAFSAVSSWLFVSLKLTAINAVSLKETNNHEETALLAKFPHLVKHVSYARNGMHQTF